MTQTDLIAIGIDAESTVTVQGGGQRRTFECRDATAAWLVAQREAHKLAAAVERPLEVQIDAPENGGQYLITPEGSLEPIETWSEPEAVEPEAVEPEAVEPEAVEPEPQPVEPRPSARRPQKLTIRRPGPKVVQEPQPAEPEPQPAEPEPRPETTPVVQEAAPAQEARSTASASSGRQTRRPTAPTQPKGRKTRTAPTTDDGRPTFLPDTRPMSQPARTGLRGALNLMGAHLAPSGAELAERQDEEAASTYWPGPRTIAVVNGKGGVGKTPTTAMLAAIFARYGGAVCAWDANPYRGTLGWRTEQAGHDATVLDLLPEIPRLMGADARAADLARYVHHQRADRYDVLRSQPRRLAADQRITGRDVASIHDILGRFYRLVLMDSGNDESADMWRSMIEHSDQIVVVTSTQEDHAEAGLLLLDALSARGGHDALMAQQAVVLITQADPKASKRDVQRIRDGFAQVIDPSRIVTIPHDPALVKGPLRMESLTATTQRAWLRAAAVVAQSLSDDTTAREGTTRW